MKAEFLQLAPQLVVADVVKTTEYYRDYLGFEILGYWHEPPVFAIVRRGSVELQVGLADDVTHPQTSNTAQRKGGLDLYITVGNIQSLFHEINTKGVKIVEPLCEQVYGMIEFAVEDCNGFKLVFGQDAR
ncbi:MAG: VOC family protein [Cyclobacteriaceae bacterium]